MNPEFIPALVTGGLVAAFALLGGLGLSLRSGRRWWLIELAAFAAVISVGPSRVLAALDPPVLGALLLLATLHGLGRTPRAATLPVSAGAALFLGPLPTLAALLPTRGLDARGAARTALFCTAVAAASPLAAAPLLVGRDPAYFAWALPPALLCCAVSWPGMAKTERTAAGYALAPRLLRLAVAAWLLGACVHACGAARWIAIGLDDLSVAGPIGVFAAAIGAGCIAEPWMLVAALERGMHVGFIEADVRHPLALGLALAPLLPLGLASAVHGRGVWKHGLPVAALQLAIAAGWVLLTP